MNKSVRRATLLALGVSVLGFGQAGTTPTRVGIINIRDAILQTKDGQKATAALQQTFGPRQQAMDKRQQDLAQIEDQYRKGQNTMSDDARQKMMRDIDTKRKQLQRDADDYQAEVDQAQAQKYNEVGQKMMIVIDKYASDRGFALILDVSPTQQSPVLYASNSIDITRDIIELYDKGAAAQTPAASPSGTSAVTAPGRGVTPAAPRPATPKPAAPPKK